MKAALVALLVMSGMLWLLRPPGVAWVTLLVPRLLLALDRARRRAHRQAAARG